MKIEEGIMLAAKMFRENLPVPEKDTNGNVGARLHRVDAEEKHLVLDNMLTISIWMALIYAKALRSKYPRARVDRVDVSKALAHPKCVTALTAKDVPFNKTGHLVPDWDVPSSQKVIILAMLAMQIALVATTEKKYLDEVLALPLKLIIQS